jgi:plasmid stabilization system protein ParE
MMRFEVLITERAYSDLGEARAFIARHAPEAAERWYYGFLEALLALEENPRTWPVAEEGSDFSFELRQFLFRSRNGSVSRALFTIVGEQVRVLAVRRPGQRLVTPNDLR